MSVFSRNGSKWPNYFVCFVAAVFFLVVTAVLAVTSFQSGSFEDGVVRILSFGRSQLEGTGSGFKVADPGYVVTNFHVVDGARNVKIAFMDKDEPVAYPAVVIWYNKDKDLAILKTDDEMPVANVKLADIDQNSPPKISNVMAVGFPAFADRMAISINARSQDLPSNARTYLDPTVSQGSVQRLVPTQQRLTIQHSANTNPGNSGGPLFDACQRVIGVNTLAAVSSFTLNDFRSAVFANSAVPVTNPGEMEISVHVREVISALRDRDIPFSGLGGECYGGLDQHESVQIGFALVLAIASTLLGAYYFNRRSIVHAGMASYHDNGSEEGTLTDLRPIAASAGAPGNSQSQWDQTHLVSDAPGGSNSGFEDRLTGQFFNLEPFLSERGQVALGRNQDQSDIGIEDSSISRRHALITRDAQGIWIEDLSSTNGISIDGQKLAVGSAQMLQNGCIVKLGNRELVFSLRNGSANPEKGFVADEWLLSGFDPQGRTIQFMIPSLKRGEKQAEFLPVCYVGRDAGNDLVLRDDTISRRHAAIGYDPQGHLSMKDLGSSNGSFAESREIGSSPQSIEDAHIIKFGSISLNLTKR